MQGQDEGAELLKAGGEKASEEVYQYLHPPEGKARLLTAVHGGRARAGWNIRGSHWIEAEAFLPQEFAARRGREVSMHGHFQDQTVHVNKLLWSLKRCSLEQEFGLKTP